MTEKRFTKYVPDSYGYTYITTIIDNEKNKQTGNIDEIVDMLNEQHETIQYHKERIAILSELLDFADAIIDLSDNEKAKNTWANKNTQLNREWKKVLLKYGVELNDCKTKK